MILSFVLLSSCPTVWALLSGKVAKAILLHATHTNVQIETIPMADTVISQLGGAQNPPISQRNKPVGALEQSKIFATTLANCTVEQAVQSMIQINKGGVLIMNELDGSIAGIFTERDFITKVLDSDKISSQTTVKEVMTPKSKLVTALVDTSMNDCRQLMLANNIRHIPLLDKDGAPVGVVSMRDILVPLQTEDLAIATAKYSGNTLQQITEQVREQANESALKASPETRQQDLLRSGFVIIAAVLSAALLQGAWVDTHPTISMCTTFLLGYIGIVFETYFEFNKAGIALLMSVALWVIFAGANQHSGVDMTHTLHQLSDSVGEVSQVVFFILGAMTIVEIVDAHQGFKVITDGITATKKRDLLRVIAVMSFFLSAILDNLTTTIVMVSLVKKLLPQVDDRKLFGGMIVIAANAGGAWTPIGDVTTTMLWINGQITALPTMSALLVPSLVSMVVSLMLLERQIPAEDALPPRTMSETSSQLAPRGRLVFGAGIAGLLSVPVFKATTGLPPYLGMLAALGVMWSLTDAIHATQGDTRAGLMAPAALKKIDTSGILFFLGILLSVGALDAAGILRSLAEVLDHAIPTQSIVAALIGFASALIDNVPLVAATMGMYDLSIVPQDAALWQLIAFCAGTGGSLLVVGSAAGVALMGLEKVDFVWYAKKITLSALAGYVAGLGTYLAQSEMVKQFSVQDSVVSDAFSKVAAQVCNHFGAIYCPCSFFCVLEYTHVVQ